MSRAASAEKVDTQPPVQVSRRRAFSENEVREFGPLRGRRSSISRTLSRYHEDPKKLDSIESASTNPEISTEQGRYEDECAIVDDPERNERSPGLTPEQVHQKAIMQCFLLEMGILFHSIFIGMSLGVAVGNRFVVLLIAIVFHRTVTA